MEKSNSNSGGVSITGLLGVERIRAYQMRRVSRELAFSDRNQEYAIAHHYAKLVQVAIDLNHLVKARRNGVENLDSIKYLTAKIKQAHAEDLGIKLEWKAE